MPTSFDLFYIISPYFNLFCNNCQPFCTCFKLFYTFPTLCLPLSTFFNIMTPYFKLIAEIHSLFLPFQPFYTIPTLCLPLSTFPNPISNSPYFELTLFNLFPTIFHLISTLSQRCPTFSTFSTFCNLLNLMLTPFDFFQHYLTLFERYATNFQEILTFPTFSHLFNFMSTSFDLSPTLFHLMLTFVQQSPTISLPSQPSPTFPTLCLPLSTFFLPNIIPSYFHLLSTIPDFLPFQPFSHLANLMLTSFDPFSQHYSTLFLLYFNNFQPYIMLYHTTLRDIRQCDTIESYRILSNAILLPLGLGPCIYTSRRTDMCTSWCVYIYTPLCVSPA